MRKGVQAAVREEWLWRQGYDAAGVRGIRHAQHRWTGSPPAAWGAEVNLPTDSFSRIKGSVHYRPRRKGCLAAGVRKIAHYGEKKQAAPHITHKCKDLRPHSTNANGNESQSERSDAEGRRRGPAHNLRTCKSQPRRKSDELCFVEMKDSVQK